MSTNRIEKIPPLDGLGKDIFRNLFRSKRIQIVKNPIGITIDFFGKEIRLIHLEKSVPQICFFYSRCKSPTVFKARVQIIADDLVLVYEVYIMRLSGDYGYGHIHHSMDETEVMIG